MKIVPVRSALVLAAISVVPQVASAQVITGIALYEQHCGTCHSSPAAGSRAPDRQALGQLTPEAILEAITTGPMAVNAEGMSAAEKRILAEQIAMRPIGSTTSGSVSAMPNHCAAKPLGDPTRGPQWSGWGVDPGNSRFQPAVSA